MRYRGYLAMPSKINGKLKVTIFQSLATTGSYILWCPYHLTFRTINSGKSKKNEDQASFHRDVIKVPQGNVIDSITAEETIDVPYYYFGMFDGHAGPGAAVVAASQLHHIIKVIQNVTIHAQIESEINNHSLVHGI